MAKSSRSGESDLLAQNADVSDAVPVVRGSAEVPGAVGDEPASIVLSRAVLAPLNEGGQDAEEFFDPSDEATSNELMVPYVTIVQKTSGVFGKEGYKFGDIILSTGFNFGQRVIIIPLFFKRQAMRFVKKEGLDCKSEDGIRGSKYGECAACQYNYNTWQVDAQGKTVGPPLCTKYPTFPSVVVESEHVAAGEFGAVVAFQFPKTSMHVFKKLATDHDFAKKANHNRPTPYYNKMWELTTTIEQFDEGEAGVFQIRELGPVAPEVMRHCSQLARDWSKAKIQETVDPFVGTADDGGEGGNSDDDPPF